jgi:hypothetical protein
MEFGKVRESPVCRPRRQCEGDPSLRLKNGYARDDGIAKACRGRIDGGTIFSKMAQQKRASGGSKRGPRFAFTVPLVKHRGAGAMYVLQIPERVSAAIGRRGPVPLVATLNNAAEVQASLVPVGGGKHRLQLNARTREELEIEPGDRVRVRLSVPETPPVLALPSDLAAALREVDLEETFSAFPAGKQNHIIGWIEESARPETRQRRIATTIEVTFRARERAFEKAARRGRSSES